MVDLEDLFILMPFLACLLLTFKSMLKDTKQRGEFSVSVNQQNPYSQINTARLSLTLITPSRFLIENSPVFRWINSPAQYSIFQWSL